jgi:HD-GYP domain-containing protein (c-di-GMP phosphodiesterase class II)/DNA-binding CsgD family transcriptional regulator
MNEIRLAELLGSLSFAGDLGRGQPMGHVLRTTRIAMAVAEKAGVPSGQLADVYFTGLLVHAGCTAGAADFAAFLANDDLSAQKDFCLCDPDNFGQMIGWMRRYVARGRPLPARVLRMMQLMSKGENGFQDIEQGCSEVGARIAARLGLTEATQLGLYAICETWNGKGPHKEKGEDIPLAGRIVNVSMIMEVFFSERGVAAAKEAANLRKGKSFDPIIAAAAAELCDDAGFWDGLRQEEPWTSVLDLEPGEKRFTDESALDDFALALADIVDLKSGNASIHSRQTAELAEKLAMRLQLPATEVDLTRRAALVHDVGLIAVPAFLVERGSVWSETDFERFRLHTYYTERILARSDVLKPIGNVAASHHEHVDGGGYHRGLSAAQMSMPARLVATASAFMEASESEPGQDPEAIVALLQSRGTLDGDCVAALRAEIAGSATFTPPRRSWPADLTDREVEVLRLVASGCSLKEAAGRLVISDHTARHHLESVYSKAGVSSRAGVTLFAVENGLIA